MTWERKHHPMCSVVYDFVFWGNGKENLNDADKDTDVRWTFLVCAIEKSRQESFESNSSEGEHYAWNLPFEQKSKKNLDDEP